MFSTCCFDKAKVVFFFFPHAPQATMNLSNGLDLYL